MSVDWSEFRDGDRVRVTFEGPLDLKRDPHGRPIFYAGKGGWEFWGEGILNAATSAELIERPFVAPEAGKLFRVRNSLFISMGEEGFQGVRTLNGTPWVSSRVYPWGSEDRSWLDQMEILNV